ncbi:unnamed protein product [Urochloa decumbens]|uniref:WRKY domain-containing protein n=1 Tax=Urochloa decumbens TaxID=240449 RepID=A0ABC9F2X9_9POAL
MELQCLKRKKPSYPFTQGAVMGSASGSCSPRGGVFGLSPQAPRHSCKRRKDKLTRVEHTLTPYFDGHLWRKYGQKVIKDAPYPRLYFRCSYREDRHCLASKLVQQVTHDDPPLYEVTYKHEHTCNAAPVPAPDIEADALPTDTSDDAALVLRFGSSGDGGGRNDHGGAAMLLQEQQQYYRPVMHPSPLVMINKFDDSNISQLHACFFPSSHVVPPVVSSCPPFPIIESSPTPPTTSWSPSFPIIESSPTVVPSTYHEGDMFSTLDWDSFIYDLDDHAHFSSENGQFPGNAFSWETSDGNPLAHLRKGIKAEGLF